MNINELIAIVKNKLEKEIVIQELKIEDKSFLHTNHKSHKKGKFHLKLVINSDELVQISRIASTRRIYSILDLEMREYIHSIQILLD